MVDITVLCFIAVVLMYLQYSILTQNQSLKLRISLLEAKVKAVIEQANIKVPDTPNVGGWQEMASKGETDKAIKTFRENMGATQKLAKDVVEGWLKDHGRTKS